MSRTSRIFLGMACALAAWVVIVVLELVPPSDPAARAAIAVLEAPMQRASGARNGYPILWSWDRPFEAAQREAILAKDVQTIDAAGLRGEAVEEELLARSAEAAIELPLGSLCSAPPASCLESVRKDPEAMSAALAPLAAPLAALDALAEADHLANPFRPSVEMPFPPFSGIGVVLVSRNALRHVQGDPEAAIGMACRDLGTWRRLRSRSDLLILDMAAIGVAQQQALLLAEMLALRPVGLPLPPECEQALVEPLREELDQCDVWRGEFRMMRHGLEQGLAQAARVDGGALLAAALPWVINERAALERMALPFASLCDGAGPQAQFLVAATPGPLQRFFDPVGTVFMDLTPLDHRDYVERALDFAGLLQALRLATWLPSQPDPRVAFETRPATYQPYTERLALAADARSLSVGIRHWRGDSVTWQVPLAAPAP